MEREKLGSRLGFILISAGCAIGIGNVWKFPYVAGLYGGGVFLFFYLLFLLMLGLPVMTMEFATGRAAGTSPARLLGKLEPAGTKWHWYTPCFLAGNWLLMMFYTVVTGWMLRYFADMVAGQFVNAGQEQVSTHYVDMLSNPGPLVFFTILVIVAGFGICARGLQAGLERVTKWMMGALLVIMVVLAVNSMLSAGAAEGVKYLFVPDFARAREIGLGSVIAAAMNQAFFTLSLGIGAMAIFGSYIGKEHRLFGESVHIALLDTFVALTAALIVIPSCFAYNVETTAGPGLIFVTLPNIFAAMPLGRLWGSLFFLFLSFAAFSTILAVFENIISSTMDLTGWSRKKACAVCAAAMMVLSLPSALGFNVLAGLQPLGAGSTIMDMEDFLVSNILLPLGSLVFVVFCTWKQGWGWNRFTEEADTGRGLRFPKWIRTYCRFLLPAIIAVILITGILPG
ncbi:sodium-dependent transporter [Faecalibaculum rodentium]|uniref:sodium-dependent transporter n=2 Tax=Faecalibaculum rodentium TaxID=1702221 RepID=UPI00260E8D2E|nr:sodium-dependent transporter [Faecalibaculum rodentium]